MNELKISSAVVAIAIFLAATLTFVMMNGRTKEARGIEEPALRQIAEAREHTQVSRGYVREISKPKPLTFSGAGVPEHDQKIDQLIAGISKENDADPFLIGAMIWKESSFDPEAQGGRGTGLMQLEPLCCETMEVPYPCFDIEENIRAGTGYYKIQLERFRDEKIALAAYNCGPTVVGELVEKYGNTYEDIKPHLSSITRYHVLKVFEYRELLKELNR